MIYLLGAILGAAIMALIITLFEIWIWHRKRIQLHATVFHPKPIQLGERDRGDSHGT